MKAWPVIVSLLAGGGMVFETYAQEGGKNQPSTVIHQGDLLGGPTGCDACGPSVCCQPYRLYLIGEGLVLSLDRPNRESTLAVDQDTLEPALSMGQMRYGFELGPRVTLGVGFGCQAAVEFSYFGFDQWDTQATAVGDADLRLPGALGLATNDFLGADQITAWATAELHNAEINYLRPVRDTNFALLGGFRYLNLTERFGLIATDAVPDGGTSDYRIGAESNLFGGQIGGRYRQEGERWGWEFLGKAGFFGADAKQRTLLRDEDNTVVLRNWRTDGGGPAFVGELALVGTLRLTPSLLLRGGYTVMWIEGVARAGDQLDFTNSSTSGSDLLDSGEAFLHGALFGLEARW